MEGRRKGVGLMYSRVMRYEASAALIGALDTGPNWPTSRRTTHTDGHGETSLNST